MIFWKGICIYDMSHIILNLMNRKYITITIDTLNHTKNNFNYGITEIGNVSPEITIEHLRSKNIKMNAREMLPFVHFFPINVG